jgi:hypothetical protein
MPNKLPQDCIERAEAAVAYAQQVRRIHRRRSKKSSTQRNEDIELALTRIKAAMAPLRSEIGRFPYGPATDTAERNRKKIREASTSLQRERRKLFKMRSADASLGSLQV